MSMLHLMNLQPKATILSCRIPAGPFTSATAASSKLLPPANHIVVKHVRSLNIVSSYRAEDPALSDEGLQGRQPREQILLSELVAVRRQVDTLLEQQGTLIRMLAAAHERAVSVTGRSQAVMEQSEAPPTPSSISYGNGTSLGASSNSRPTDSSSSSNGGLNSSVSGGGKPSIAESLANLYAETGLKSGLPDMSDTASAIAAAIAAVDQQDVLKDLDFTSATTLSSASPSAPSTPQHQPQQGQLSQHSSLLGSAESATVVEAGAPQRSPPILQINSDDIYWMNQLHSKLAEQSIHAHDEEVEAWFFGETTLTAVLTFQASAKLPETGVVCTATWEALLAAPPAQPPPGLPVLLPVEPLVTSPQWHGAHVSMSTTLEQRQVLSRPAAPHPPANTASQPSTPEVFTKWPLLMENDGGRAVHALHVALLRAGCHCGEEEMRWWMFDTFTNNALKTFQACNQLPETGTTDVRTWKALLGDDAQPSILSTLHFEKDEDGGAGQDYEEDMTSIGGGRVWLLGEQRWSRAIIE